MKYFSTLDRVSAIKRGMYIILSITLLSPKVGLYDYNVTVGLPRACGCGKRGIP